MSGQNALNLGGMGSFEVAHPAQDSEADRMAKVFSGHRKSPIENLNDNFLRMYSEKISEAVNLAQTYRIALQQAGTKISKSSSLSDIRKVEERQRAVETTLKKLIAHQRATLSRLE